MSARPTGQCVRPAMNEPSAAPAGETPEREADRTGRAASNASLKYGISATKPTEPTQLKARPANDVARNDASRKQKAQARRDVARDLAQRRNLSGRFRAERRHGRDRDLRAEVRDRVRDERRQRPDDAHERAAERRRRRG